jgi:outer membrane immunogenic protein
MSQGFLQRLIGSLAGCCLLGGTAALAADLPPAAPALPPPPVFTWTGPYVGLHVGGAFAGNVTINPAPTTAPVAFGRDGVFGGLHLGYNYQVGAFVLGLQAEYNFAGITGSVVSGPFTFTSSVRQFGSVDGRLGLAFDRWLVYAIGGFAYLDARHSIANAAIPFALTRDYGSNEYGWDVGGGVEYAFWGNWTGRVEYRYYRWGNKGFTDVLSQGAVAAAAIPFHTTTEQLHTVRAGLTYKFNWPSAPVVARY